MATSEKRLYTYAELVGNFAKAFPSVAEKARHYQRLDEYGLFIVLKGGDKILYNGFDHSYINIPKDRSKMTNEDYKKEFAYCLKRAMQREDMSQSELYKKTGILQSSISRYLSAHNQPSFEHICKLALALHCSITDFRYY